MLFLQSTIHNMFHQFDATGGGVGGGGGYRGGGSVCLGLAAAARNLGANIEHEAVVRNTCTQDKQIADVHRTHTNECNPMQYTHLECTSRLIGAITTWMLLCNCVQLEVGGTPVMGRWWVDNMRDRIWRGNTMHPT